MRAYRANLTAPFLSLFLILPEMAANSRTLATITRCPSSASKAITHEECVAGFHCAPCTWQAIEPACKRRSRQFDTALVHDPTILIQDTQVSPSIA